MKFEKFSLGPLETNSYVISSSDNFGAIIDPVKFDKGMISYIKKNNIAITSILITHSHLDHVYEANEVAEHFNTKIYMHSGAEKLRSFFRESCHMFGFEPKDLISNYLPIEKEQSITIGNCEVKIITCPGHSPCGISLVSDSFVISGDTLFEGSMGRYDLPFASLPLLYQSLKKLAELPSNLTLLPGHGSFSTIENEKRNNPYLKAALGSR